MASATYTDVICLWSSQSHRSARTSSTACAGVRGTAITCRKVRAATCPSVSPLSGATHCRGWAAEGGQVGLQRRKSMPTPWARLPANNGTGSGFSH